MVETEKTREQLTKELAQARSRIAELEAATATSGKISSLYHSIFENFVESATDSFSMWDSNLNLSYINNATLKYHPAGTKKSDVIGKNIKEMIPNAEKSGRYEKYKHVLETGEPLMLEDFKADPKYGDTYLSIKVFKISDGIGIVSSDITERKRMEQALQDKQQRLSALIDNAPDVIFTYDINGRFLSGNKKAEELMGYTKEEMLGKTFAESGLFTEESLAMVKQRLDTYKQGKVTEPVPYELIARDGSHIFVEVRGVPIVQGNKTEVIAIARDITERKRTEDALRQSEEKLRAIFESIGDSITVIDGKGNIIEVNDAAIKLFGCKSREEALGTQALSFIAEEYKPSAITKLQESKPTRFIEYRYKRMDGSMFWGETSSDVLYDQSGNITGFIGIVRDITERKKMEDTLRQSEERLRTYFENAPDAIFIYDFNGVFLDGNRKGTEITGYSKDELIGNNFVESGLFSEEYALKAMNAVIKDARGEVTNPEEYEITRKDGQKRVLEATSFVVKGNWKGEVVGIARDITERKRMEESLRRSEEKLRRVLDSMEDGISVTDLDGTVLDVNEKALELSGYSRDEFIGKFGLELLVERDRDRAIQDMINTFNTGHSGLKEYFSLTKDGREFPAEARSTVLYDSAGKPMGLVSVLRDITERKQMEEKLRQSEEKIRQIFNSVGVGITVTDMQGKVVEINDFGLNLCKFDKEELLGHNGINLIAERDRPRIIDAMIEAFKTGKSSIQEFTSLKKDGTEYEVEAVATVTRDAEGKTTGLIISITDITERKRIDRELKDYKTNLESMVEERTSELAKTNEELRKSEERLRNSEEKLRTMFTSMADGVVVTDLEGYFKDANMAAVRMFGYSSKEDVRDANGFDFIADRDRELALKDMAQLFAEGLVTGRSWTFKHSSGSEFKAELSTALLKDNYDNPSEILVVMRDITERKRIEEALRVSEEKLRATFEAIADGIAVCDLNGKLIDMNTADAKLFGYETIDQLTNHEVLNFVSEADRTRVINDIAGVIASGRGVAGEYKLVDRNGKGFDAEVRGSVLRNNQGETTAIVNVIRDITERKRMEEALRESEEWHRALVETSGRAGVGIAIIQSRENRNAALVFVNDVTCQLSGYSREELLEMSVQDLIPPDALGKVMLNYRERQQGEHVPHSYETVFLTKDNVRIPIIVSVALMQFQGKTATVAYYRDMSERKHMEEALRESEAKLRAIYDSIGDGITVTDLKGHVIDLNAACIRLAGFGGKEEALGINGLSFIAEVDRDRARNDMFNVLQKGIGITTEYKLLSKNGKEFDSEVSGAIISDSTGKPSAIVNVIRDITDRKQMEEALKESEAKYRSLVEQSEQGICILQNGKMVFANNALARMSGYTLKEMYAMPPDKLLEAIHPADRATYKKRITGKLQGVKMPPKHEYKIIKKDKTERDIETYTKRIIYKGTPAIQATIVDITDRKQWEERLNKSKEELRFYLNQITKAQEEERKRIARELHDDTIQELITLSRRLDDLVDKKIKPDEDRRRSRQKIEEARQKVTSILQGVREFTRDLRPSILDDLGLVPALEWLISNMSSRFGIPINISIIGAEKNMSPDAALVMFRVAQESLNNAGNHAKASQIQVNLKYTSKTATITIIDNGIGFTPPKQISNLTKNGKLGIAGMYERAQLVGATLFIKSKRNAGTTVTLDVPIK